MQTLAVDPRILRLLVGPGITVVPGRAMMARVVATNPAGRGSLSIAGFLIEAELPEGVQAGEDLRLVVRDVSSERVLLSVAEEHPDSGAGPGSAADPVAPHPAQPQPEQPPATGMAIPLPGGGSLQVTERRGGGGGGRRSPSPGLSLRYNAPALGAMDLRLTLDPAALSVTVTVARGEPYERARAAGDELRQALTGELKRSVSVAVNARHEPLDLYA